MVLVLLAASVVLTSFSLMFGQERVYLNRTDTRWLLTLQLTLLMLAIHSPNLWVGIVLGWIAIHSWVAYIGFHHGPVPFVPEGSSVFAPLIPILLWGTIYTLASSSLHVGSWKVIAWTFVIWSLINTIAAVYQSIVPTLPASWRDERCTEFPNSPGLVGGSFNLAFITALGVLSGVCLMMMGNIHYSIMLPVVLILATSSIYTGTISPIFAVALSMIVFAMTTMRTSYGLAIPVVAVCGLVVAKSTSHIGSWKSRYPAWISAIDLCFLSWFIGTGLGSWWAMSSKNDPRESDGRLWVNLHNDWLQGTVELGPIPALCGLALLTTSWYHIQSTPDYVFGLLITTIIALYAIVFFPLRDHMTAILLAVSIALMGVGNGQ